jgi:hypothetical protein
MGTLNTKDFPLKRATSYNTKVMVSGACKIDECEGVMHSARYPRHRHSDLYILLVALVL